jgi:hypothetical protein
MDVKVKVNKMLNDKLGYALNNFKIIEEIYTNLEYEKNTVEEYVSILYLNIKFLSNSKNV